MRSGLASAEDRKQRGVIITSDHQCKSFSVKYSSPNLCFPRLSESSVLKKMATNNSAPPRCTLFYNATIITVNQRREIIQQGYIRVDIDRITEIGQGKYPIELPTQTQQIDCQGKIIIPGLINSHAHLVQSLLRGLAEDLPLHNWLCDAIWPLEAVFADDDGYHATRLTTAEMLKTGTTCFLDPMLTYRAGFDQVCTAVSEMGIRGCLVCFSESVPFYFKCAGR